MKSLFSLRCLGAAIICASILGGAGSAQAQTANVFADEFNAGQLDNANWQNYADIYHLQRTQWGLAPQFGNDSDGTKFLRVPLQSYNPNGFYRGKEFYGCQLVSRQQWNVGGGLEYEARIRSDNLPRGLVLGFFSYGSTGIWKSTYQQTEIDYEFLTNQGSDRIWLNIWDNYNPERGGPNKSSLTALSGLNWNNNSWNVFKIRWYPNRTEWWANGRLMRTETIVKPASPMGVRFNLWAAASGWGTAYDANLKVASTRDQNQNFSFDVDYIRVRTLPPLDKAFYGNGTGLTATYYDNSNLTGTSVTRVDPRIAFDWGNYAPEPTLGVDTFSAVWNGQIQAQYTQDYTFTARTDDGVRVYLNNKLVINNWRNQGATDAVSSKIRLTAGAKIPIRVEYYDNTGGATAQLFWSSSSTPKQLVPVSQLYPVNVTAKPVFSPVPGTYPKPLAVKITSTSGSTIRYTLDNSTPNENSPSIASGAAITLTQSATVVARAYRAGWAPGDGAAANYVLNDAPDTSAPTVSIAAPANNSAFKTMPALSGAAADNAGGSGLQKVAVVISRLSDNLSWNGSSWVAGGQNLPATLNGANWNYAGALPTGANLSNGAYQLKAVATDNAGNSSVSSVTITIDTISPSVSINSAATLDGSWQKSLPNLSGVAADGGSGIDYLTFVVKRLSDNKSWNGSSWVSYEYGLTTIFDGTAWNFNGPFPTGANLLDGAYELKAVAWDKVGYANAARVTINIDTLSPSVAITSLAANATISELTMVSGTTADRGAGSGASRVNFTIIRNSDSTRWNGWVWVNYDTGIPCTLTGQNWTISSGSPTAARMPTGSNFPDGSYQLKAISYDVAGNANVALVPFTKVTTSSSARTSASSKKSF